MANGAEKAVATKMAAQRAGGRGASGYYVENQGQKIGPYQKQGKAQARLRAESTIAGESGNTGKTPELTYVPKGTSTAPAFNALHRLSPTKPAGNGQNSRGWDYQTNQQVRRDTAQQRTQKPRGYQGK